MPSVLTAAAPSSSLVIRREKRRRRKNAPRYASPPPTGSNSPYWVLTTRVNMHLVVSSAPSAAASVKRPRRGFTFGDASPSDDRRDESDSDAWRPAAVRQKTSAAPTSSSATSGTTTTAPTFAFRVKHGDEDAGRGGAVNADAASAALREQQEKAAKLEQRRLRLQKKKEESEREARLEAEVKESLSADQAALYHIVHAQVKRELRKTKKQFASSSGRHDVINLTEKTFHALKRELIEFMRAGPPTTESVKLPNPENARLRSLIDTYEKQMTTLDEEEQQWTQLKARVEADKAAADSGEADAQRQRSVQCELKVTREVAELQRAVIKRFGSTTRQLDLLEASMATIDQLIVEAEVKKATLFNAFHDSAFKGYANVTQPKENLRALLKYSGAP